MKTFSYPLSFALLAFSSISGVYSIPLDTNLPERQSGTVCAPGRKVAETVTEVAVTDMAPINGNITKLFQADGYCSPNNQICQLRWRDGNFVCQGYCNCSQAAQCTGNDNYCFQAVSGTCICT